jgi:tetratricopeptide (TPR) repeat protein
MLDRHPSREQLDRYVQDELPLPQRRRIGKHVSVCSFCQRREHRLLEESSQGAESYEASIRRAALGAATWLKRFEDESHHARELLAELLRDPGPDPLDRLRQAPQTLALKLLQLLKERCRSSWSHEPVKAVELAELEVVVAERLDEARCGSGVAADSRALAWADLGNSYRILSDLGAAEMALKKAVEHQRLSGDPLTESEILSILASLRRGQGRFDESFALFNRVLGIAREGDDRHREGRALIAKGTAMGDEALSGSGKFSQAVRILRKGVARLDLEVEPQQVVAARHNVLYFLAEAGRSREAEQLLEQERHLYQNLGSEVYFAKLHWLEGTIADGFGRLADAQVSLWKARELLSQQQLILETASVSLRLGLVLCKSGQRQKARSLVEEAVPVLETLGTYPDALAAKLLSLRLRSS